MTTPISAAAAANRENSRTNDGRFGTQPHGEAVGVALAVATSRPRPIMATVILERWDDRDNAVEVGRTEFDASRLLAELSAEQRQALNEVGDFESLDNLFYEGVARGLLPDHEGPFTVRVADALQEALEENPRYFDDPASIPDPPRHPDAILSRPLTPFELGARMAPDTGIISGRTAITLDDLIADGQEEHNDMVDRRLVGNLTCLEEISTKPVGVTADGKVILEMSGWAGDIDQYMTEDQRTEYEAGRVSRAQD